MSDYHDQDNKLFVSFIHPKNKQKLRESVYSTTVDDILNAFDPFIKECDDIVQLLYREYVIKYIDI